MQFELFAPEHREFLNYERSISAAYEGKWQFDLQGTVQPFERPEQYQARRIRDRFTLEMLQDYCRALGVHPFDADFYERGGVLINIRDPLPEGHPVYTLSEARTWLGLPPTTAA